MRTIHKYKLDDVAHANIIDMPEYAEILTAQVQGNDIYIWAMHDTVDGDFPHPEDKIVKRKFHIYGTGWEIPDESYAHNRLQYIATVQMSPLVWHVFEEIE